MRSKIIIIGAGGHGKVMCDAIIAIGEYEIAGFIDASVPVGEIVSNGYKVIATQENIGTLKSAGEFFIVAIGNNQIREKIYASTRLIFKPATIVHPTAVIGSNVKIGEGSVVLANSVIHAFSKIGENTIVNSGVVIDHDNKIGDHVHLSIGTMVGSNSVVADNHTSLIGDRINSFSKIG